MGALAPTGGNTQPWKWSWNKGVLHLYLDPLRAPIKIPISPKGYRDLETWARAFGVIHAFGIEGTGSYGAGLSRFLQAKGHSVVVVNRPNRQLRHQNGKSDPLDAESAARAVLSGQANVRPKSADSSVEMIRHLKVAPDTAVKSRTQAMVTLKTIIINAPAALRQALDRIIGKMAPDPTPGCPPARAHSLGNSLCQGCLAGTRATLADA
jgi:hypothetical protein